MTMTEGLYAAIASILLADLAVIFGFLGKPTVKRNEHRVRLAI